MRKLLLIVLTSFISLTNFFCLAGNESPTSTSSQYHSNSYFPGDLVYSSTECYEIQHVLGEGAFGKVYAVKNSEGKKFALKCYKLDPRFDMSLYSDPEREFERGQLLDHPNIIKSVEFFIYTNPEGESTLNLVLQYVEGNTVNRTPFAALNREEGISALLQVHSVFSYALLTGFIYLDLHPDNVMISSETDVMVIDLASFFSIAEISTFVKKTSYLSTSRYHSITQKLAQIRRETQIQNPTKNVKVSEEKLQRFFLHHPELYNEIQQLQQSRKSKIANYLISLSSKTTSPTHFSYIERFLGNYYLDKITDLCVTILRKSTITREERMDWRVRLKKISWNYQEDIDEGKIQPVHVYLDQLSRL